MTKPPRHVALAIVFSPATRRILMITSRSHPHLWIMPKGGIEEGESSGQAACREAWEEAGIPQTVLPPTDDDRIAMLALDAKASKRGAVWHVQAIDVEEEEVDRIKDWPEKHERRREWVDLSECQRRIHAWSAVEGDDISARPLHPDTDLSATPKQQKKALRGGAMEQALRLFAERRGISLE